MNFSDITKKLKKVNPNSSLIHESDFYIKEYIDSGNYALNALMSGSIYNGFPSGKITVLAGDSGTGKTFLCLNAAANAIRQGYHVIYFDTEAALDTDRDKLMKGFGIDTEKLLYVPLNTIEDLSTQFLQIVEDTVKAKREGKDYPKLCFFIDSVGKLSTMKAVKEMYDGSGTKDMTRAGLIRNFFAAVTVKLAEIHAPLICTNHTISNIGNPYSGKVQTGGSSMMYSPSLIVFLSKSKDKNSKSEQIGIIVKAKTEKNRLAIPGQVSFQIRFDKGMNPFVGLQEYFTKEIGIYKGKWNDKEKIGKEDSGNTIVVEHLEKHYSSAKHLFSKDVFTEELLEKINLMSIEKWAYNSDNDEVDI